VSSKIARLLSVYRQHITVPWQSDLAAAQRVIFAVYDKSDELRLRAQLEEFALVTQQANKQWLILDLTLAFPEWMAAQEYREAYFRTPKYLAGYPNGELVEFVADLCAQLKERIRKEAYPDTVVALLGIGALFGLARASSVIEGIKEVVQGRLLVFFPGEYHHENHAYRLLDARDGWSYLAVPLIASN